MCCIKGTVRSFSCQGRRNRMDGQLPGDMSAAEALLSWKTFSCIQVQKCFLIMCLVRFSLEHCTRSGYLENLRVITLLLWVVHLKHQCDPHHFTVQAPGIPCEGGKLYSYSRIQSLDPQVGPMPIVLAPIFCRSWSLCRIFSPQGRTSYPPSCVGGGRMRERDCITWINSLGSGSISRSCS